VRGCSIGKFIPRTDGQTIVAAIDAIANRGPKFFRDRSLMFNCQIGNAAPGIELVRRCKGLGRTSGLAGGAAATMVWLRRINIKLKRGVNRAEKQPTAMLAADQIAVLALPAQACLTRQRLFHHRRCVNEHLQFRGGLIDNPARQGLESLFDNVMIILALGINRNTPAVWMRGKRKGVCLRGVAHPQ
jgi:hypothetical protein